MRVISLILFLAVLSGCGPLFLPMQPRLDPDTQRQVDQAWDNMLTPYQRVDRQTLLDANISFWMFTIGVDRMHMTSEKYFIGGRAVMDIDCDRANPDADQYSITIFDDLDRTVRRERYTRADVEESAKVLYGSSDFISSTRLGSEQTETPQKRKLREQSERRRAAAIAATQPARLPPSSSAP